MSKQKVYILIPTRNRHDVLRHALQTCLMQDYENLEIVVSDNFSTPETQQLVSEVSDPRVRYQRSSKRLCMKDSWEFAISAVSGDAFVHVMGDDNGIVPGTIENVVGVAADTGLKIVHGQPCQYTWPHPELGGGYLDIPTPRRGIIADSGAALRNAYKMRIGFDRLPTINTSFVHTSVIAMARSMAGGRYFAAANPDVYSAAINAICSEKYVYLSTVFFVNGASRHSNGASSGTPGRSTFHEDNIEGGYTYHRDFPPSSVYSFNIAEAFAVAADYAFVATGKKYALDHSYILKLAVKEYIAFRRGWLKEAILHFAALHGLKVALPELPENTFSKANVETVPCLRNKDGLVFASEYCKLNNVAEASVFAGAQLSGAEKATSPFRRPPLQYVARSLVLEYLMMGGRRM
jgi:glycosyltransferase involved in cell wall biosynthesis